MTIDPQGDTGALQPPLMGKRIFVAEDDALLAIDIDDAICAAGGETVGPVARVPQGLEALDAVSDVDGAVLDVDLDGADVFPIAKVLVSRGVPMVFYTGRTDTVVLNAIFPNAPICRKPEERDLIATRLASII